MYPTFIPEVNGLNRTLMFLITAIYIVISLISGLYWTLSFFDMVPEAGIEPARSYLRVILSPLRLPIPPPGQLDITYVLEAEVGIEPASTALQAAA